MTETTESEPRTEHQVELTDRELAFVKKCLDEKVTSSDLSEQDRAVGLLEKLPEVSNISRRAVR